MTLELVSFTFFFLWENEHAVLLSVCKKPLAEPPGSGISASSVLYPLQDTELARDTNSSHGCHQSLDSS